LAILEGKTLNQFIREAIELKIKKESASH